MKPLKPSQVLACFRVYPGRKRTLYFSVVVFTTKKDMNRIVNRSVPKNCRRSKSFAAMVCSSKRIKFPKNKPRRTSPCLGEIFFYRDSLRMGIICHESGHAALAYCERMKIDPMQDVQRQGYASDGEEKFCWALGNIARQIVIGTARVIYKTKKL